MNRAFRCVVPAGVAVQGARALVFAAFVVLATPAFLYATAPPLRGVQTALWWSASLILLLCWLLGTRVFDYAHRHSGDDHAGDDDAGEAGPGVRLAPLLLFGSLALLVAAYWHGVHLDDLRSLPIDSRYADMLPLMLSGFADLDQGRSPYRPHEVPWTLTNYFLPLTFLPYFLAYKCGFDIRYVNLACFALIGLAPLLLWPRTASTARQVLFFGCWVLTVSAFHAVIDSHRFTRIIHLGPYWLYVAITYVMLLLGRPYAAAGGALCAVAARETAVFHVAPLCVALLRFQPATARIFLTVIPLGLGAVFLPFFLDDPSFYSGNLAQYSSLGWVIEESGGYHFVGLTGLLNRSGLLEYHWCFQVVGVAICLGLYLTLATSWDTGRTLLLCFCCTNVSTTFALVPWPYLTMPSLLLLTMLVLGGIGPEAGRAAARG